MKKEIRNLINATNAQKSTGPKTPEGKQRASLNAWKHGLTGNRMILQTHEHEAYERLTTELTKDLAAQTELERQLVQKIIDSHTRLNRIAALDGNILNFGLTQNETAAAHDDALETIAAQCRSWIENADSFEKLGRYEARISRQLLQYTKELERLRAIRHQQESRAAWEAGQQRKQEEWEAEQAEAELRKQQRAAQRKAEEEEHERRRAAIKSSEAAEARQSLENARLTPKSGSFGKTPLKPSGLAPAA